MGYMPQVTLQICSGRLRLIRMKGQILRGKPQFSTPKGFIIQSPTHHVTSMNGSSYKTYVRGKGKASMENRHSHPLDDLEED
ncbi:hypothetical protein J1N35_043938 [Gossypium stocksii]|uniref:Uncharacterized protein n=1 Tax=Gossypium stocksii TaxID=47602 RepID=A0A9D3U8A0_9ROSI|nr:hypothetical protein J1N35_043938 [Gossypium stocksii]